MKVKEKIYSWISKILSEVKTYEQNKEKLREDGYIRRNWQIDEYFIIRESEPTQTLGQILDESREKSYRNPDYYVSTYKPVNGPKVSEKVRKYRDEELKKDVVKYFDCLKN